MPLVSLDFRNPLWAVVCLQLSGPPPSPLCWSPRWCPASKKPLQQKRKLGYEMRVYPSGCPKDTHQVTQVSPVLPRLRGWEQSVLIFTVTPCEDTNSEAPKHLTEAAPKVCFFFLRGRGMLFTKPRPSSADSTNSHRARPACLPLPSGAGHSTDP